MELVHRTLTDLVDENYVYAHVLYYFGIQFYDYSEKTLAQVCAQKGLDVGQVVRRLEAVATSAATRQKEDASVENLPVDLVIEYLKHAHYLFIKQQLPYVARLIENIRTPLPLVHDLKMVFPLFVEDFIQHIYEEEDTLFTYILQLKHARQSRYRNVGKLYYAMEMHSIHKYAVAHDVHDDEMMGMRKITNGYAVTSETNLHLKVVYAELQAFERDLQTHARVENEVLFPKALSLESEVRNRLHHIIAAN